MGTGMNQQTLDARRSRQALLAGSVGNFIEWYEFGVYGFLATVIAANFSRCRVKMKSPA